MFDDPVPPPKPLPQQHAKVAVEVTMVRTTGLRLWGRRWVNHDDDGEDVDFDDDGSEDVNFVGNDDEDLDFDCGEDVNFDDDGN